MFCDQIIYGLINLCKVRLACLLLCIILRLNKSYFNIRLDGLNLFTSIYLTWYCLQLILNYNCFWITKDTNLKMRVYIRFFHLPNLFLPELLLLFILGSLVISHCNTDYLLWVGSLKSTSKYLHSQQNVGCKEHFTPSPTKKIWKL